MGYCKKPLWVACGLCVSSLLLVNYMQAENPAVVDMGAICAQFDEEVSRKGLDSWEKMRRYDSVVAMEAMDVAPLTQILVDRNSDPVIRLVSYYLLAEKNPASATDALFSCWYNPEGAISMLLTRLAKKAEDEMKSLESSEATLLAISRFLSVEDTAENRKVALFVLRRVPARVLYDWLVLEKVLVATPGLESCVLITLGSMLNRNGNNLPAETKAVLVNAAEKYKHCTGLPRLVYLVYCPQENPESVIEEILTDSTLADAEVTMLFYSEFARNDKERFATIIDDLSQSSANQLLLKRIEKFLRK